MFRSEVMAGRADRLSGDVAIATPVAWQAIGYLMFGSLVAAFVFLSLASYSRVEVVAGALAPAAGISSIVPSRSGVVTALPVWEGARVPAGAVLAAIRSEEDSADTASAAAQMEGAIAQQDVSLRAQADAALAAAEGQQAQIAAERSGLSAEIAQLRSQVALQRELVARAREDIARVGPVAERGYVSQRDLRSREETLLQREQQLAQLGQSLSARQTALAESERRGVQVAAQARAQAASIAAARAQVAQQAASASGSRAYVLRAPVAGQVTAIVARVGQPVSPQAALMTVVPAGSPLLAELAVPSSSIGFVRPGQEVRLAIDAFPYQRFGTVGATVRTVARAAIPRPGPQGAIVPVYPVTVELKQASTTAYGRRQALIAGMTLTARIVTERQTLIEWLFEPLYAVRRR